MMHCLILGDSIAVGVASEMQECSVVARIGINAPDFWHDLQATPENFGLFVISLGSNSTLDLVKERNALIGIRCLLHGPVVWLAPVNRPQAEITIERIAAIHADRVLYVDQFPLAHDGVHPTRQGYAQIAVRIHRIMGIDQ